MTAMRETVHQMKLTAPKTASLSLEIRNAALAEVAKALTAHKEDIFAANKQDLERAEAEGVSSQVIKRLKFDEGKLSGVIGGIEMLIGLADPVGKTLLKRELDEGLVLTRVSVPLGVVGVIFEARPDALVQISTLCIKSGNCAVLKGGKETANTNRTLFAIIHEACVQAGMPTECLYLAEQHSEIDELLTCEGDVDLLVPRGSNAFVRYIMENTKIPVMGHADGVCHLYVDVSADQQMALRVIADAKTQYPVACNAVETVLVDRRIADAFLPILKEEMDKIGVTIRGTKEVAERIGCEELEGENFHIEYGDLAFSLKLVDGVQEAVDHINRWGSHHTDGILTMDDAAADYFMQMVDSAGVYRNCSTRFADGFRYGFGAELGISTSKLHARGPVGLDGLVTYKYTLEGSGQIVGDYAQGVKTFHYKELM